MLFTDICGGNGLAVAAVASPSDVMSLESGGTQPAPGPLRAGSGSPLAAHSPPGKFAGACSQYLKRLLLSVVNSASIRTLALV